VFFVNLFQPRASGLGNEQAPPRTGRKVRRCKSCCWWDDQDPAMGSLPTLTGFKDKSDTAEYIFQKLSSW